MAFPAFVKKYAVKFLDYDTPKFVHIESKKIGALCRVIQLLCIGYVVGYDLVYLKGYQKFEDGVSGVTAKVKGIQYDDGGGGAAGGPPGHDSRVWDAADYVVPPQMTSAFFVMTNVVATNNQTQRNCSEDPTLQDARCKRDSDCAPRRVLPVGNGAFTGSCLKASANASGTCEIAAWCPLENDTAARVSPVLGNARNFTVLIKNYIFFPYYNKYRSNVPQNSTKKYLQSCVYNPQTDPFCPIFRIGDMINSIPGESFDRLALLGGVVSIRIGWDCNLDYSIQQCLPQYSFARLDSDATDALISQGYNFRYSYNYVESGVAKRTLIKAYGILFIVSTTATAGAFHVVPLLFSVGSGIGLLSVSSIVCDFVLAYVDRKRHEVKEKKYDHLSDAPPESAEKRSRNPKANGAAKSYQPEATAEKDERTTL